MLTEFKYQYIGFIANLSLSISVILLLLLWQATSIIVFAAGLKRGEPAVWFMSCHVLNAQ